MSSSKVRGSTGGSSAAATPVASPTSSASTSTSTTAASIASRAAEKLVQRQGSHKSLHVSASTSASSLPVASIVSPTSASAAAAVGASLAAAAQPEHAVSRVQRATSLSKIQTTASQSATALAKTAQKVGSSIVDDSSSAAHSASAPKSPALSTAGVGGVSVVINYDSNSSVGSSAPAAQARPSLVAYDSTLLTRAKNARPSVATAGGGFGSSALASYDSTLSTGSIGEVSADVQPPTPLAKRGSSGSLNKISSYDSSGNGDSSPSLVRSASAPIAAGLARPTFSSVVQIIGSGGGEDALPSFGIQSPKLRNLLLKAASTTKRKVLTQAIAFVLTDANHRNPEFPPPFVTPMYRLGVSASTMRTLELDLCLPFSTAQSALRSVAVAALAETLAGGDDGVGAPSALVADLDSPDFVDGDSPTTPELLAADAAARKRRKERKRAARKGSKGGGDRVAEADKQSAARTVGASRLLYFPYIANTPEVNWEAPCRIETRNDLVRAYLHVVEATTHVLVPLSVNGYQHHPLVLGFAPPDVCARAGLSLDRVPTVMHAFPPPPAQLGSRADQAREDAIENPVSPAELAEFLSVPLSALERRPQRSCLRSHASDAGSHSGSLRSHTSSSHTNDVSSPPHSASLRYGGGGSSAGISAGIDSPSPASPTSASLQRRDAVKATRRSVSLDPSPQILDVTHSPSLYEYHTRVMAAEQQSAARAASAASAAVMFAPTSPGASQLGVPPSPTAASALVSVALSSSSSSPTSSASVPATASGASGEPHVRVVVTDADASLPSSTSGAAIARHARFAQLAAQEHAAERRVETALHLQHEAEQAKTNETTTTTTSRGSLTPLAISPKASASASNSTAKTVATRRLSDDSGDGEQPDTGTSSASDESEMSRSSTMLTDVRFGGGDVGAAASDVSFVAASASAVAATTAGIELGALGGGSAATHLRIDVAGDSVLATALAASLDDGESSGGALSVLLPALLPPPARGDPERYALADRFVLPHSYVVGWTKRRGAPTLLPVARVLEKQSISAELVCGCFGVDAPAPAAMHVLAAREAAAKLEPASVPVIATLVGAVASGDNDAIGQPLDAAATAAAAPPSPSVAISIDGSAASSSATLVIALPDAADAAPTPVAWTARHARRVFVAAAGAGVVAAWVCALAIGLAALTSSGSGGGNGGGFGFGFGDAGCVAVAAHVSLAVVLAALVVVVALISAVRAWATDVVHYASDSNAWIPCLCCSSRCAQALQTACAVVVVALGIVASSKASACAVSALTTASVVVTLCAALAGVFPLVVLPCVLAAARRRQEAALAAARLPATVAHTHAHLPASASAVVRAAAVDAALAKSAAAPVTSSSSSSSSSSLVAGVVRAHDWSLAYYVLGLGAVAADEGSGGDRGAAAGVCCSTRHACVCVECVAVADDEHAVRIDIHGAGKTGGKTSKDGKDGKDGKAGNTGGAVDAASPFAPIAYEENACSCGARVCGASSALWCAQQPFGCCGGGGRGGRGGHDDDDEEEGVGIPRAQACVDPRCCSTFPADCCALVSRCIDRCTMRNARKACVSACATVCESEADRAAVAAAAAARERKREEAERMAAIAVQEEKNAEKRAERDKKAEKAEKSKVASSSSTSASKSSTSKSTSSSSSSSSSSSKSASSSPKSVSTSKSSSFSSSSASSSTKSSSSSSAKSASATAVAPIKRRDSSSTLNASSSKSAKSSSKKK